MSLKWAADGLRRREQSPGLLFLPHGLQAARYAPDRTGRIFSQRK